jgi:hypothetical protein
MKLIILVFGSVVTVIGLMIFQLRSMKKYHPNVELLISVLKLLGSKSVMK